MRFGLAATLTGLSLFLGLSACTEHAYEKHAANDGYEATSKNAKKVPLTASATAQRQYLLGRGLNENLRGPDAREQFKAAVATDPDFAMGHLGLANTSTSNKDFVASLSEDQPVFGVQSRLLAGAAREYESVEAMAADYGRVIRTKQQR